MSTSSCVFGSQRGYVQWRNPIVRPSSLAYVLFGCCVVLKYVTRPSVWFTTRAPGKDDLQRCNVCQTDIDFGVADFQHARRKLRYLLAVAGRGSPLRGRGKLPKFSETFSRYARAAFSLAFLRCQRLGVTYVVKAILQPSNQTAARKRANFQIFCLVDGWTTKPQRLKQKFYCLIDLLRSARVLGRFCSYVMAKL